jgi:hypothetical protein
MGDGNLKTCPSGNAAYDAANCTDLDTGAPLTAGEAVVRFLNGNKYAIEIVPPDNDPNWFLTATLEGTRGNDAWVRPAEPRFNILLGQLNWLIFYGFVKTMDMTLPLNGDMGTTISGQVVYVHDQHPPLSPGLSPGLPVPECYVGLNNLSGADEQVYTAPCNPDSTPASQCSAGKLSTGDVIFDQCIIDFHHPCPASAATPGTISEWPSTWFGRLWKCVLDDGGGPTVGKCLKTLKDRSAQHSFSDGSIYSSPQIRCRPSFYAGFPWWRWLSLRSMELVTVTGVTAVVMMVGIFDADGNPLTEYAQFGINPQIQPDGLPYRIELGEVYTEPMLPFADMTYILDWGKSDYLPGENTSIAGVIYYATTRTEEDPQNAVADPWEPAIPRVKVQLYKAKQNAKGKWVRDGRPLQTAFTDSFDDSNPTGCVGRSIRQRHQIKDCAETIRTWASCAKVYDGATFFADVPGQYIVQVIPPAIKSSSGR